MAMLVLAPVRPGASAQALRDKTIRIVVPFPPSGLADSLARLVSQQISNDPGGQRWSGLVDEAVDMYLGHISGRQP